MTSPVYIIGTGARTPLGLTAAPSAAAVRAGIRGLGEHPYFVDQVGNLMPGALDPDLDPHLVGAERLMGLAESALREACAPLTARGGTPRLPLLLALPEIRPGFSELDAEAVRAGLSKIEALPVAFSKITLFTQGHAAGFLALATAVEQLRQGAYDACLIGGVDSYFQPDTMEWLDANRQLTGEVSRCGFIPGEGAGFCLLMNERARERLGATALARVSSVGIGKETKLIKTQESCFGEGLTSAVRDAVSGLNLPGERIHSICCDINGERYRSEEWGFVCLRLSSYFDDPTAYLSPAENWGDLGAASAPVFAMLACQSYARGYSKGPRSMLWASSEAGERGVAVLESMAKV